jgi:WD40 repeat protein
LVGVLSAGLMLTSGVAIFALYQVQQAQRQRAEQWAANAEVLLADNQSVNAAINVIAATGLSQSAFVQFPDCPQFASVDGSLLDVVRDNREQNQLPHESEVYSVAFSPDGQRIVSGSVDKTVRIWDAKTGAPIGKPLTGHENPVTSVAFSPDGQRIVSGSVDKTVRIWNISTMKSLLPIACNQLRYHPSLKQPTTDVGQEAEQTCEQYVWKP